MEEGAPARLDCGSIALTVAVRGSFGHRAQSAAQDPSRQYLAQTPPLPPAASIEGRSVPEARYIGGPKTTPRYQHKRLKERAPVRVFRNVARRFKRSNELTVSVGRSPSNAIGGDDDLLAMKRVDPGAS